MDQMMIPGWSTGWSALTLPQALVICALVIVFMWWWLD